jgi:hypothetical protein
MQPCSPWFGIYIEDRVEEFTISRETDKLADRPRILCICYSDLSGSCYIPFSQPRHGYPLGVLASRLDDMHFVLPRTCQLVSGLKTRGRG